jgi:hypothetical protein
MTGDIPDAPVDVEWKRGTGGRVGRVECVPLTDGAEKVLSFVKNAAESAELNEDFGVRSSEEARSGTAAVGAGDRVAELRNSGKSLKSGCGVCRDLASGEGHDCC